MPRQSSKELSDVSTSGWLCMPVPTVLDEIQITTKMQDEMSPEIEIKLKNNSTSRIVMLGRGDLSQVGIFIFKNGTPCKRSEYGSSLLLSIGDHETSGPVKVVAPSESWTWRIYATECYSLNEWHYLAVASVNVLTSNNNIIEGKEANSQPVNFNIK